MRALADRITRHAADDFGTFVQGDVELLASIGQSLVSSATRVLDQPDIAAEPLNNAQFRLEIGNDVLAVRDVVRDHGRDEPPGP